MKKTLLTTLIGLFAAGAACAQSETAAFADTYTTAWDQELHVGAPGLLQNDRSAAGALTATLAQVPQSGSLTLQADGSFVYVPESGVQGPVTFVYGIADEAGDTSFAPVTIDVTAGNKAPLAIADYFSVRAGSTLTIASPGLLGNDIDLDGDVLSAAIVTAPDAGRLSINEDGGFVYESEAGTSGDFSFTYRVIDAEGASAVGTAFITVTSDWPPVANADSFTLRAGESATLDVLANDSDDDGNRLQVVAVTQPEFGQVTFTQNGVTFHADADFVGRTQFNYTINDGVFPASAIVTVDVTAGNQAPVVVDDLYDTPHLAPLFFNPLSNDYDPNGTELRLNWLSQPQFGTLQEGPGEWIYTPGDSRDDHEEVLLYSATDGELETQGRVVIRITGNYAPEANDDYYQISINPSFPTRLPLLSNDRDIDGDELTIARYAAPSNSSFIVHPWGDGKTMAAYALRGGTYRFTYWVTDGRLEDEATVELYVPGPSESVANDDAYTLRVGQSIRLNTFANDVYYEHNPRTAPEHTNPGHGALIWSNGDWTYMHLSGQAAETSFTYTLPGGSTATVTLTILPAE